MRPNTVCLCTFVLGVNLSLTYAQPVAAIHTVSDLASQDIPQLQAQAQSGDVAAQLKLAHA